MTGLLGRELLVATVYSNQFATYDDLPQPDAAVRQGIGEYVRSSVYTNDIESFWSMLKSGYVRIYHKFTQKHLDRYMKEYAERRNLREFDTVAQMS